MNVAILDDYQDAVRALACFSMLAGHEVKVFHHPVRGLGQLAIRLQPFDALVLIRERTALTGQLLARLPNLKLIVQTGRAGPHIDRAAAAERGIAVAEGSSDPHAAAELTWALVLAGRRKLLPYAANLRDGLWQTVATSPALNTLGDGVRGATLGIWGYGRIGSLVAGYGRAFGMRVLVWGSEASRARAVADGCEAAPDRAALFAQADVLSLHLRLAEATAGIVTAQDLAGMKPGALFVNTSRAQLVAEGALEAALRAGRPGAAAIDVFEEEPPARGLPLLRLPNVLATPHLGYVERGNYERMFGEAFAAVNAFAARH
jgi:D-3-phosphoglycerate dehydrogenase